MDINALSAMTDFQAIQSQSGLKLKENLSNTDYANKSDEDLLKACREFESYFLEMVFKEMQKSVDVFSDKKDQSTSQLVDYFKDLTVQSIASSATETQGLGLAQQLYEQMKRNYGI